jgi:hypothetical protein
MCHHRLVIARRLRLAVLIIGTAIFLVGVILLLISKVTLGVLAVVIALGQLVLGATGPISPSTWSRVSFKIRGWFRRMVPPSDDIIESQREWIETRRVLNRHRAELADVLAETYPQVTEIAHTGLISKPGWIPPSPVPLRSLTLSLNEQARDPILTGGEEETQHVRPRKSSTHWYRKYTDAMGDLARPHQFHSLPSWRLLEPPVDLYSRPMEFGPTMYFEALDVCEALAHEAAKACVNHGRWDPSKFDPAKLPFRNRISDPFDLGRRAVLPAIGTLLIRNDSDNPQFLLERRSKERVAIAGDMLQVIPSGAFQPSGYGRSAQDFDLWKNILREFAEELLGYPEYGAHRHVNYDEEPFAHLRREYDAGNLRVFFLGVAMDALTLWGEILTVIVMRPDAFDSLARTFTVVTPDGEMETQTLRGKGSTPHKIKLRPFNYKQISELLEGVGDIRLAPAGAGCLVLSWKHRDLLLGW